MGRPPPRGETLGRWGFVSIPTAPLRSTAGRLAPKHHISTAVFELLPNSLFARQTCQRDGVRVTARVSIMMAAFILLTGQLSAAVVGPPSVTGPGDGAQISLPTLTLSAAVAQDGFPTTPRGDASRRRRARGGASRRQAAESTGRVPDGELDTVGLSIGARPRRLRGAHAADRAWRQA